MASLIGYMGIIYVHSCCTPALTRWQTQFYCQFLKLISLFLYENSTFYILFEKKNQQNVKYWIKRELEKSMKTVSLLALI